MSIESEPSETQSDALFDPTQSTHQSCHWTRVFWLFLAFHFAVWTIVPSITAPNQTLDALEMVGWGTQWQWGYYKHPPLPAWIAQTVTLIFGNSNFPLYGAAAVASSICLWSAFILGKHILGPAAAVIAATSLEASHYFSFSSVEFNNNVVSRAMAALALLSVYKAMQTGRVGYWSISGAFIGLGLLAKYDIAVLIIALLIYAFVDAKARRHWVTPGPYFLLASALVVSVPHLIWAYANDFPTLKYAAERSASSPSIWSHVINPIYFCVSQSIAVLPVVAFILLASRPSLRAKDAVAAIRRATNRSHYKISSDDRLILAVVFGGFAIIVLLSLASGAVVRSMWGSCLWTFSGVAVLVIVRQFVSNFQIEDASAKRATQMAVAICVLFSGVLAIRQSFGPELRGKASRVHFPGSQLAQRLESAWRTVSQDPLPIVVGDGWLNSNVIFYGDDHPVPYIDGSKKLSPWVDDPAVRERGGIVVWEGKPPSSLLDRFNVSKTVVDDAIRYHGHADLPPLKISYAIISPATKPSACER